MLVSNEVDFLFRTEYGKIVSFLVSRFGYNFVDHAEDIAQETLLKAIENWEINGIPSNPQGWIFTVAKNKAINLLKRESKKTSLDNYSLTEAIHAFNKDINFVETLEDNMLSMIFACCSFEIKPQNQIILVLSVLCGFSRKEISNAFLIEEENVKKRLYRSKQKIRETNDEFVIPKSNDFLSKVSVVLNMLYVLFNEGYNSSTSDDLIRKDICFEAMRLCRLLLKYFPDHTNINALFSLMCFHTARFNSRVDDRGAIVLLKNQNRKSWNLELINAGIKHLATSANGKDLSFYHLEAGIALEHCTSRSFDDTNWEKLHALYSQLYLIKPSPVIKLNLAVIKSKTEGVQQSIFLLEELRKKNKKLKNYYLLYATLGEFYKSIEDHEQALRNFTVAKSLTDSKPEIELITKKMNSILTN